MCDPKVASPSAAGVTDYVVGAAEYLAGTGTADGVMATALDDYTFQVVLKNPSPFFLNRISADIYCPVKKECVDLGEGWEKKPETFVCNGAFKLAEYQIGSHILMVKNDAYYEADKAKLPGIRAIMVNDENTSLQGYKAGEIHCTEIIPAEEVPSLLAEDPNLIVSPICGTKYLDFNVDRPVIDDVRVRRALTLALNRKEITDQITRSGEIPATGFLPPTTEKTDGSSYRTMGANGLPEPAYGITADAADVATAQKLLAEAGYPNGEGFPTVEYLYNTADNHKKIGEALQNMWQTELGVTVNLNNQDWNVFLQNRKDGNFQIARNGWIADYNDPCTFLDMWYTDGGNNDAQYSNPDYDAAIDAAKATSDPEERMKAFHEAEDILIGQDSVLAPIYFYTQPYMLNPDIDGMYYTPLGYFFFGYTSKK